MSAPNIIFDLPEFKSDLLDSLGDVMQDAVDAGASQLGGDAFHSAPEQVLDFIRGRQNNLADTADDIHAQVKAAIEAGVKNGDSLPQLTARVEKAFAGITSDRAETIARTETSAAYGFGQLDFIQRAGIKKKMWVTSGLPNTRPAHLGAEGQTVDVDKPFIVGGEQLDYPGDDSYDASPGNVINCRCSIDAPDTGLADEILPIGL